jgi:hypothetical protein
MNAFFSFPGRHIPALVLVVLGGVMLVQAIRSMPNPTRPGLDIMAWLRGFRRAIVGFTIATIGLAWFYQLPWLLAIALGIGLQEIRESSSYINTLIRYGADRRRTIN